MKNETMPSMATKEKKYSDLSNKVIGYGSMFATFAPGNEKKNLYNFPDFVKVLKTLPNQVLRFPGGTDADFYDWKTETVIEPISRIDHPGMRRNLKHAAGIKFPLKDFLKLCNSVGAVPTITLPVYEEDAEYIIALIDKIKNDFPNQEFPFWELGNEEGLQLPWKKRVTTQEEYLAIVRPVGQHIMKVFPNSLVAATAEGYLAKRRRAETIKWNKGLMKANLKDKFFNSIVIHKYVFVPKKVGTFPIKDRIKFLFAGSTYEAEATAYVGNKYFDGLPILPTEVGIAGNDVASTDSSDHSSYSQWWVTELANLDYLLAYLKGSQDYKFFAVLRHMLMVKSHGHLGRPIMQWGFKPVSPKKKLKKGVKMMSKNDPNSYQPYIKQGWNPVTHSLLGTMLRKFDGGKFTFISCGNKKITCEISSYKDKEYAPLRIIKFTKKGKKGFFVLNKTNYHYNIQLGKSDWNIQSVSNLALATPEHSEYGYGDKQNMIKKSTANGVLDLHPYSVTIGWL